MGDEQTLRAICEVMDWDFDELQSQVEKMKTEGLPGAQTTLGGIVPDDAITDPKKPIEEEPEE